jgi:hypothetical protein
MVVTRGMHSNWKFIYHVPKLVGDGADTYGVSHMRRDWQNQLKILAPLSLRKAYLLIPLSAR